MAISKENPVYAGDANVPGDIQADLAKPIVESIIKNYDGTPRADGLVPRSVLEGDLEFIVPAWDFSQQYTETIRVGWRPEGAPFHAVGAPYDFVPPIAPGDKTLVVPMAELRHGNYELSYEKTIRGINPLESLKTKVRIDRESPNDGQQPLSMIFPDELNGVISEQYLIDNGEVRVRVPRYVGAEGRDRAIYYWTNTESPLESEPPVNEQEFSQYDVDNNLMYVRYDEADIRSWGTGTRYAYYRLRDLAGNLNAVRSSLSSIRVDLTPLPGGLLPPRIPLSSRGLIDREHAREGASGQGGVTVEIDAYDDPEDTQFILVDWDGTKLSPHPVDISQWPQQIYVPWSTLTAKGLGPLTVQVDYIVQAGGAFTPPSGPATAPVDFTIAGQDHANAPALLNTTLVKLEVWGLHSNILNTLTALDENEDATVKIALFDDPKPGETIYVFWGAVSGAVADYTVKVGDTAGQVIPFTIPWDVIAQDKNNRALPVYYLTDNGVNQQQARVTDVDVSIVLLAGLMEPEFPDANLNGYLNCCSVPRLWQGITVHVPGTADGNPHLAGGDVIELTWQGSRGLNGTDPIPGVTDVFSRTLSDNEARDGFDVVVLPYDRLIEPMVHNDSGVAQYRLLKANGGVGRSRSPFVKITRQMPGDVICGPDNDLCPPEG
ncbi:hypothetical protein [Pseudomonas gingeri]|uniref:Uncharacterized protein n=1 Tax=Pseudomonas gingeri TaxID=117681 RepID=A0A7Y8BTE3_9PSED|nr:hypothetical protein [Pseudomonas gingeri]NWB87214.1 hypothetical protein [Pseudomonas gingeri]